MEGENGRSPGHGDPSKSDEEGGGRPSRRSRTGTNDDEDCGEGPETGENFLGGDVEGPRGGELLGTAQATGKVCVEGPGRGARFRRVPRATRGESAIGSWVGGRA